ncbi:MAG TPA: DUF4197 domain-containing protein [Chitinophagaceae bacterium]|jgi:hypothetical protein|nr:DUF4197 domain-containing protein [Chitinophagaceae bacterium]
MKKLFLPILFIILLPLTYSCGSSRLAGYMLNENDAASAIRQLLEAGVRDNALTGAFSKETILSSLFPAPIKNVLNTLNTLGLTNEIDRFTTTLSTASEKTASASVPIFINSINNMKFNDAMRIIKNGGTSATDYLRASTGDSLRRSIRPVMEAAINEYKLNDQWDNITRPAKAVAGNKLNLDLPTLMSGIVAETMFRKIAEKETQVRTNATARTTPLMQKVFSKNWN